MLKAVEASRVAWCWHLERESNSLTSIPDLYVVMKEIGEKKIWKLQVCHKSLLYKGLLPWKFSFQLQNRCFYKLPRVLAHLGSACVIRH